MQDDMRGLFFIMKGQYRKGVEPSFTNSVTGDSQYLGGYNPTSDDTEEWYMLMDKKTFHCVACDSDLDKVLKGVHTTIKRFKGVARKYFKHISDITSDDYYEVTYLGRRPLDNKGITDKAEGRCPRVSPAMRCLYERVLEEYGDYFSEEIEHMEELAYSDLKDERPLNKARKLVSKNKNTSGVEMNPQKDKKVLETTQVKIIRPKVRIGVKKLSV